MPPPTRAQGISKTALKNACRSLGLERWPFRRNVQSAKRRSQGGADAAQDSASDEDEDEDGQDAMPPGHGLPKPVGTAQEHVDSVAFNDMGFLQQPCPGGGFSPVAAGLAPHFMPGAAMHAPAHHGLAMARQMHPQQQQQHLQRGSYGLAAHAHARLAEAAQPRAALLPEKQALPSAHAAHAGHAAHTQQPVRGRPGPGPCYEHGYALGPAEMSQLVTHAVAMPPAAYAAPAGRRGPAPLPAGYESAALHGAQGCRPSADGAGSSALSAGGAGGAPDEDAGAGAQLDGAHAGHRAGSGSEGSPPRSDASGEEGAAYDTNSSKSMAGSESSGSGVARGASAASCATTVAGAWGALRGKAPPHHGAMPPSGGAPVPGSAADAIPRGMPPQVCAPAPPSAVQRRSRRRPGRAQVARRAKSFPHARTEHGWRPRSTRLAATKSQHTAANARGGYRRNMGAARRLSATKATSHRSRRA